MWQGQVNFERLTKRGLARVEIRPVNNQLSVPFLVPPRVEEYKKRPTRIAESKLLYKIESHNHTKCARLANVRGEGAKVKEKRDDGREIIM